MANFDITLAAEDDLTGIWLYTHEKWGFEQAETYFDAIQTCCNAIGSGHARPKRIDGLPEDARVHRCEQHYIFFLTGTTRPIIFAILHGRMDFLARLGERLG